MIAAAKLSMQKPDILSTRLSGWLSWSRNKQYIDWALSQLNIKPYQHLLEVGYGPGHLLEEVARTLKIGFLGGIESSLPLYQQAYRRNKRFIRQQLLQLQIGELYELSYPPRYFHTIYGSNAHFSWKDPAAEYMRLSSMLKSRGKLVMLFQPKWSDKNSHVRNLTDKIHSDFTEAGLVDIRITSRDLYPVNSISAIGFKA